MFKIGDLVTRKSYNNDIVFKIVDIIDDIYYLNGVNIRLCADSEESDLVLFEEKENTIDDSEILERISDEVKLDRNDFFYLPGKILHIDGDKNYLERCLNLYRKSNILAYGIHEREDMIATNIRKYLEDINPDILVITGHDAYYKKKGNIDDIKAYKNTDNFIKAVKEARKYEKAHDKLIIIAGACGSFYEALIKSGANFASSPKRINIHALDPAIIAIKISTTDRNKDIDLINILEKTKYGKDSMGGVITKGTMYIGYPRV
jgi:spore coat assembly protein